jgi:hypothetical protein
VAGTAVVVVVVVSVLVVVVVTPPDSDVVVLDFVGDVVTTGTPSVYPGGTV